MWILKGVCRGACFVATSGLTAYMLRLDVLGDHFLFLCAIIITMTSLFGWTKD